MSTNNDHATRYNQARDHIAQTWLELEHNRIPQAQEQFAKAWAIIQELEAAPREGTFAPEEANARNTLRQDVQEAWAWALQNLVWPAATRNIPDSPPDAVTEAFEPLKDWAALVDMADTLLSEPRAPACIEAAIVAFRALLDRDRATFVQVNTPLQPRVCQRWLCGFDSATELVRRKHFDHANSLSAMAEEEHSRLSAPEAWERLAEAVADALRDYWRLGYLQAVNSPIPVQTFQASLSQVDQNLRALAQNYWREDRQALPTVELGRAIVQMLERRSSQEEFAQALARIPVDEWDTLKGKIERALVEEYQARIAPWVSADPLTRLRALRRPDSLAMAIKAGWQADELVNQPLWREEVQATSRRFLRAWLINTAVVLSLFVLVAIIILLILGPTLWGWVLVIGLLLSVLGLAGALVFITARRLLPRLTAERRGHLWRSLLPRFWIARG